MAYRDNPGARTPAKPKKKKIRRTPAPSTTDRTSPNPSPPAKPKKGPQSPQRTGRATRPQPVTRKRDAPPARTDRTSDAKRTPEQKKRDKAGSEANIREARIKVLRKRSKPLTDRITVSSKGTLILKSPGGPKKVGKGYPGATANPLDDVGSPLGAEVNRIISKRSRPEDAKAPAVKALDLVSRPAYAVGSAAKAKVKYVKEHGYKPFDSGARKAALKGAERGITGKEKSLGSDVLKEAGVKNKYVAGAGGLVFDFVADPTRAAKITRLAPKTHFERAARTEEAAAARAAKPGRVRPARPKKAERHKARAEKLRKKAATASESPGIQIGSEGRHHRLMTSGKTTSRIGAKLKPASDRVANSRVAEAAKGVAAPTARRAGETVEERDAFLYAERKRRARANEAKRKGHRRGTAHGRAVSQKTSRRERAAARKAEDRVSKQIADLEAQLARMKPGTNTYKFNRSLLEDLYDELARHRAAQSKRIDEPAMIDAVEEAMKKPLTDTMRATRTHPAHKAVAAAQQRVASLRIKHERVKERVATLIEQKADHAKIQKATVTEGRVEQQLVAARKDLSDARQAAKGTPRTVEVLSEVADRKVDKRGREVRVAGRPYSEIRDKADKYTVDELPPKAQDVARATQKELGEYKDRQQNAGIFEGDRDPYYPHRPIPEKGSLKIRRKGRGTTPGHAKRRKDERPISEQHAERAAKGKGPVFSTDHPTVMGNYVTGAERALGESAYLKDLKAAGKPLTASNWAKARDTDGLYRITDTGIQKVTTKTGKDLDDAEVRALIASGDDVTILPKSRGDAEVAGRAGGKSEQTQQALRILNKPMQVFKTAATVLNIPFYQIRNFMDDSFHAFTADTNLAWFPKATALVKDLSLRERREGRKLDPAEITGTIEIAGKDVPRAEAVRWAVEDGAARTGFFAGDDLLEGSRAPATGLGRVRPVQKIREWSQNAEDIPRMATYFSALDRGMTRREAAAHMRIHHFDYDELTDIERVIRATLVPFYTYTKKNTVLMARLFVTRPGKLSAIEKLRQEFLKLGTDDEYKAKVDKLRPLLDQAVKQGIITQREVDNLYKGKFDSLLTEADQRGLPFLGPDGSIQYMPLGITDLNRLPFVTSWDALSRLPGQQFDLAMQMIGPQKLPLELHQNYSFFFRDAIFRSGDEPQADRWVTAPPWAKKVGFPTRQRKVDGKMVDEWPAKLDYSIRSLGPQAGMLTTANNPAKNARGAKWTDLLLKQVTGVRRAQFDDRILAGVLDRASDRLKTLTEAMADINDDKTGKAKSDDGFFYSKQYERMLDEQKALQGLIDNLRAARTGTAKPKQIRLSRRPLTPEQQLRKELKDDADEMKNFGESLRRELERDAAKMRIENSGG